MQLTVISVGKLKERYLKAGIEEYAKRLRNYGTVSFVEVADEPCPEQLSDKERQHIKQKEGARILSKIKERQFVVALAIEGELLSSPQLADLIDQRLVAGDSHLVFVIGGSLGLDEAVYQRANRHVSFGRITLPHQLMRLVLVEQLYRACRINNNHAYHK